MKKIIVVLAFMMLPGYSLGAMSDPNTVNSAAIRPADGTSGQAVNAGDGIKTDHVQNGAITGPKIADGTITADKLAIGAVNGLAIADSAITEAKIHSVSTKKLGLPGSKIFSPRYNDTTGVPVPPGSLFRVMLDQVDTAWGGDVMYQTESDGNHSIVIPEDGVYQVFAWMQFKFAEGGQRGLEVRLQPIGSSEDFYWLPSYVNAVGGGLRTTVTGLAVDELKAGDVLKLYAYQNSPVDIGILWAQLKVIRIGNIQK